MQERNENKKKEKKRKERKREKKREKKKEKIRTFERASFIASHNSRRINDGKYVRLCVSEIS